MEEEEKEEKEEEEDALNSKGQQQKFQETKMDQSGK